MRPSTVVLSVLLNFVFMNTAFSEAKPEKPPQKREGWSFKTVSATPILSGGRLKPLGTFARETVLLTTASRSYKGWDPVELMLSWMVSPASWEEVPFIAVKNPELKKQLLLDEKRNMFTPNEIVSSSTFMQYMQLMSTKQPVPGEKKTGRDDEMQRVLSRITAFRKIVAGDAWALIPSEKVDEAWHTLTEGNARGQEIRAQFAGLVRAYYQKNQNEFERYSISFKESVQAEIPEFNASKNSRIRLEEVYNRFHPFLWSWIIYLFSALLWSVIVITKRTETSKLKKVALFTTLVALIVHVFGFGMRIYISGRPPVSNMYESIIWVSFGVMLFALVLFVKHRNGVILGVATFLSAFSLIVADAAPTVMDPGIHPLVPVLRSNLWLTVHVLTITLGYAAYALSFGLAHVVLFHFLSHPETAKTYSERISTLNLYMYKALQFGTVLLAAGTILGGVWADYSWGRFWGWDPKEVWALIALMGYLIVLHGRYAGYLKQFSFAMTTALCFTLVLMAWYGVNFVLGVGLHSYGFAQGGVGVVASFVLANFIYFAIVGLLHTRRKKLA